ncbi:hypothetical protein SARC_03658 [Sphaeroforma arctica JP610]|uniref:Glutathione S-transferase n=1 Tax=Sphaeroforma arctica JP610 TaxID=667725 RepID=A0A0L0G5C5_9EUKA|nr:hypothetical protein SARC_03658 [Sphaeroforma arctica JP610]KNC84114.1 hypothetical protein SARC_03658 [Sphaeroforma arctica JP610]|eukprot:XP_014158016.1 hypothetical protein SARC_03658 [Sphaeroforma arctica JP610]
MSLREFTLRLYHMPGLRSNRVVWAAAELGISLEMTEINVMKKEHFAPEYVQKCPDRYVPMLEITDNTKGEADKTRVVRIVEATAIIQWLVEMTPDVPLSPPMTDIKGRAEYQMWMSYVGCTMDSLLWTIRLNTSWALKEDERSVGNENYARTKWARDVLPRLTPVLKKNKYILGDKFSAADVLLWANLDWSLEYDLISEEENPDIYKYYTLLRKRKMRQDNYPPFVG